MSFLKKKMARLWFYIETINEGDGTLHIWTETEVASKQIPAYYDIVREEVNGPLLRKKLFIRFSSDYQTNFVTSLDLVINVTDY
jgi:hypothetical protein